MPEDLERRAYEYLPYTTGEKHSEAQAAIRREATQANGPVFYHQLIEARSWEWLAILGENDALCDACGNLHYTDETECYDTEDGQHCLFWYDCEPCCRCGDQPNVLYGPPRPEDIQHLWQNFASRERGGKDQLPGPHTKGGPNSE